MRNILLTTLKQPTPVFFAKQIPLPHKVTPMTFRIALSVISNLRLRHYFDDRTYIARNYRLTMSGLEKALFNLKVVAILAQCTALSTYANQSPPQFTAKQLNRQAAKAGKDEQTERSKLKKVLDSPQSCYYFNATPAA